MPWLTALAAWKTPGTHTRGAHFTAEAGRCDLGAPGVGDVGGLTSRHGLALTEPAAFSVERRRG